MHENETLCGEIVSAATHARESAKKTASLAQKADNQLRAEQEILLDHTGFPIPACTQFCGVDAKEAAQRVLEYDALKERLEKAERERSALEVRCSTFEKMVREYQDEIVPGYRSRAENAQEMARLAEGKHVVSTSNVAGKIWFGSVGGTWEGYIENKYVLGLVTCSDDKTVRICINNDFWADKKKVLEQICKAAKKALKGDVTNEEAHH